MSRVEPPANRYGFTYLILAPKEYHAYLKGRLDSARDKLIYCVPCHRSELTGSESAEEFALLKKGTLQMTVWNRQITPKILLRFDNPKTRSGTGDSEVLVKLAVVHREIVLPNGVSNGFVEITNYESEVIEVLSPKVDQYALIRGRDDSTRLVIAKNELVNVVDGFLVS